MRPRERSRRWVWTSLIWTLRFQRRDRDPVFLQYLSKFNMIERSSDVCECADVVFVKNKDGRLRLIFDTCRSKEHLAMPKHTSLPSCDTGQHRICGQRLGRQADVDCCVIAFPNTLRHLSAIAEKLGLVAVSGGTEIIFTVRVVPMGWKWAVALIQAGHLKLMSETADSSDNWVRDRTPVPPL